MGWSPSDEITRVYILQEVKITEMGYTVRHGNAREGDAHRTHTARVHVFHG